jgi:LPXTG-motif cell wall-anchored protein
MAASTWLPQSPAQDGSEHDLASMNTRPLPKALARFRPDEGWVSIPLVAVLAFTMAWSIADARWVLGRDDLSSYLIWLGLAGALWGYLSARMNLPPWLAHTIGAVVGAFVVIEVVGSSLPGAAPGLVGWFNATGVSVTQAYLDLTWRHQVTTTQYGHYEVVLGILVWGTAQAASYDTFGYHRSVNGVLLLAVILVANMSLTLHDQYPALVLFSAAALLLLLQSHAADERSSWLRHRIWRARDFEGPHLQGGIAFASLAVCGALILTTVASSAPLAGPVQDFGDNFQGVATWLSAYLPNNGQSRFQGGADFQSTSPITAAFSAPTTKVFTVQVPNAGLSFHWRMVAYDQFQSTGWADSQTQQDTIEAGKPLDAGTIDETNGSTPGRIRAQFIVTVQDPSISHVIVANEPDSINTQVGRTLVLGGKDTTVASLSTDARVYTITSNVPDLEISNGLTEAKLQGAGSNFPQGLLATYTQGVDKVGVVGKNLLDEIRNSAQGDGVPFATEYDVAKEIQNYLRSTDHGFVYDANIQDIVAKCTGLSTVDCFAQYRRGFCQQYATTMTMLMRMEGFPARYVLGYLPTRPDPHSLIEQVTRQQQHAWVEVYFPNYGWVPFDPTGGSVGVPTVLPPGSPAGASATPSRPPISSGGSISPSTSVKPGGATTTSTGSDNSGAAALIGALLVAVLLLALFVVWRRRPRRLEGPDTVYRGIVRLASRLGYRPEPTQTVYEYTGMLAERVPRARDPLGVVATATVEVTYGRRTLAADRMQALAVAQTRVRRALLRLAFRLPRHRKKGRRTGGGTPS